MSDTLTKLAVTAGAAAATYALYRMFYAKAAPPAQSSVPEQAGGHSDSLKLVGDRLHKRQQGDGRGAREAAFLKEAGSHPFLKGWAPKFYGEEEVDGVKWTVMSNLLHGFKQPIVMDLKLGTVTWTPGASAAKRAEHERKAANSTSLKLGVRVVGGKVRCADGSLEAVGSKSKADVKDEEGLKLCLSRFLCTPELRATFAKRMEELHGWFDTQTEFNFFGSSVLLAFDAAVAAPTELRSAYIDFPHVHRLGKRDDSCVVGAATLNRLAKQLV